MFVCGFVCRCWLGWAPAWRWVWSMSTISPPRRAISWAFFRWCTRVSPCGRSSRDERTRHAIWCCWVPGSVPGYGVFEGQNTPSVVRDLYLMSGLWAGWWFIVWWANAYSPGRYVVHLIVPATIHVMAGLSLADRETLSRIDASFRRHSGVVRAALFAWLALPTAVLLATVVAGFAAFAGLDLSRLSSRIALIFVLVGIFTVLPLSQAIRASRDRRTPDLSDSCNGALAGRTRLAGFPAVLGV